MLTCKVLHAQVKKGGKWCSLVEERRRVKEEYFDCLSKVFSGGN